MRFLATFFAFMFAVSAAWAADPLEILRREGYASAAAVTKALPVDPKDSAWEKAAPISLIAYPQSTVKPGLAEDGAPPLKMELRVLAKGREIALRLSWPDAVPDSWRTDRTDAFADAAALQFVTPGKDGTLPYIGMGEPGKPVKLWFWRQGQGVEHLAAHGFGSLEKLPGDKPESQALWENGAWHLVFKGRAFTAKGPLALSVALWNGGDEGRDGRKRLTSWHLLTLPGARGNPKTLAAIVREAAVTGDIQQGKELATTYGCIGCHRLPGAEPAETGPDLTQAGGLHWPGYLRRSLENPSGFLVPSPRYAEDGNLASGVSLMPRLELSTSDVDNLTAYLHSLR